jgi:phosphoglycolate phosphatase-like HAD superfamily hydrolase
MADASARLVLWDIDGTLLQSGGVGAEVFDRAIERAVGSRPPARITMSGKTDPQICREHLGLLDLEDPDAHIPAVLGYLAEELAAREATITEEGHVLPGVERALETLGRAEWCHQSVLSGNLAANALVKLRAFSLERFLDTDNGAYGSDNADRNKLVPLALERSATRRGVQYEPGAVWVIGDSPNDLACARAGGVRCALVATGRFGPDELSALGPDACFDDLADTEALVSVLRS